MYALSMRISAGRPIIGYFRCPVIIATYLIPLDNTGDSEIYGTVINCERIISGLAIESTTVL